jgi:hypothetical protein
MHEKKTKSFIFISLDIYILLFYFIPWTIYNNLSSLSFSSYYFCPISGSTVETTITTTTTNTTTETSSSLGVTINNTTITTTEKMLIVNTGENGSDIANSTPIPAITENDNTNNNNY